MSKHAQTRKQTYSGGDKRRLDVGGRKIAKGLHPEPEVVVDEDAEPEAVRIREPEPRLDPATEAEGRAWRDSIPMGTDDGGPG